MSKILLVALAASLATAARAASPGPQLGAPITPTETVDWNISVYPDGRGLPPGRGTAKEGRLVYDTQCASCHGAGGQGGASEQHQTGKGEAFHGGSPVVAMPENAPRPETGLARLLN